MCLKKFPNKQIFCIILFILSINSTCISQEIIYSGNIKDDKNSNVFGATVYITNDFGNTIAYCFSNLNGDFSLKLNLPKELNSFYFINVKCLGFIKQELIIKLSEENLNLLFELKESNEILDEVLVKANKRIKISNDTTTIKVNSFKNYTEQTIEDVLRKLPGIEIKKNGDITAHGKLINKLLIEGEDLLDKNYKILSKTLDAKILDEVQIIDNFEDNPIIKKLITSDKVALNIKLKKNLQNIWFGNVNLGSGILSDNRWKESLNLGLLKKKIKLFYLTNYNNTGEKAEEYITKSIQDNNPFNESQIEKVAKISFDIQSNQNTLLDKTQTLFNNAFLNSLTFNKSLSKKIKIRGVGYFTNDTQIQDSFSETIFNLGSTSISNSEINNYKNNKKLSSAEIELKYYANNNNYFKNVFIYKNNPSQTYSDLIFNSSQIKQVSKIKNETFYNHFDHTFSVSKNKVLNQ